MAKGKKTSLKAALSSQQSRLKKKQEAEQAARVSELKRKKQPHALESTSSTKLTIPFVPSDKILLVGEGNFSYTRSLLVDAPPSLQYLPAESIVATAYDEEKECYEKYPEAESIVRALREKGVQVLFQVDATKLEKCQALRGRRFDKIVWNFPHAGKGIADQDRNILSNQVLLLGFLRSASHLLATGPIPQVQSSKGKAKQTGGESDEESEVRGSSLSETASSRGSVLVTLRNVPPYTLWDLPRLAKKPPPPQSTKEPTNPVYRQLRSFKFHRSVWKGYEHRMTKGERAYGTGTTGQGGEDRTWEFCLAS